MQNKVSIIIPVYNSEEFIEETLKSIYKQTYKNFEAICIDDYSSDCSCDIINKYVNLDNRFKLIKLKKHMGASIARNIGIRKATGRYLCFLDSDDLYLPNKIEEQVNFITKNRYEMIYCSYRYMNSKGTKIGKKIKIPIKTDYSYSLKNSRILTCTVMIDLNKILKRYCYMPNIEIEDTATWLRILKKGFIAYGQDEDLALSRIRPNSRSSNKFKIAILRWKLYRFHENLSFLKTLYYFSFYIINSIKKRFIIWKPIKKYNTSDLTVCISAQNLNNDKDVDKLISNMNMNDKYLIINQCFNKTKIINKNVITKAENGLSKSRNLAINSCNNKIILFSDNDISYKKNYADIIINAYNKYPKTDIICFYVKSKNKKRKSKRMLTGNVGYIKSMRICTFEITINKEKIKKNNLLFDEEFGSGAKYNRGEEQIFLCDALRKRMKIKFINKKIGEAEQRNSTWFKKYDKNFFETQGKIFRRMIPSKKYKLFCIQYAIRKYFLYRKDISFHKALESILK